ncbi:NusA-like transcription termination signal-binding factor [Methanocaldococcus indicus]|uniref:NusA-like transcription termination signal-binding factor n=1 Tax=Methanocaldococcus indicus TaxID=213231 RepID=UPI003C6D33A0
MSKLRLTTEEIMKMAMFEKISKVYPIDCLIFDDRIAFIVKEGEIGAAVGKGGEHVKEAEQKFGKKIDIIEYSNDWRKFVRNVFAPLRLNDIWIKRVGKDVIAYIKIHPRIRRAVFGERGSNLKRALDILKRHTKITKIKVIVEQPQRRRQNKPQNQNNIQKTQENTETQ